ncbi:hypothetical protein QUA40_17495 [Microcoleus sp. Pol11C3]|uniref:hypothetical protein n=1 Tax=Microcoleus sp. Pol11C3 TaxID=3055390 RepID=UPI002FD0E33E
MADLSLCLKRGLFAYNNAPDYPCYIVIPKAKKIIPKAKKRLFKKQLGRPISQKIEIFQLCKAINIEDIESKWERYPNIIQKISYGLGQDAPIN